MIQLDTHEHPPALPSRLAARCYTPLCQSGTRRPARALRLDRGTRPWSRWVTGSRSNPEPVGRLAVPASTAVGCSRAARCRM